MYQYDDPTVLPTLPTPAAPGTAGFFTDGNPGAALPATILRSDFMNMLMMELLNVVEASGQVPSKTTYNQLLTALTKMCSPVVGGIRNGRMYVPSVSSTATFTANEVAVKSALGGPAQLLPTFSQAVSLAATGIGGIVGTAPAANGFAALYAAWGPTVGAGIFATNGASLMPQVYAGTLPAGYTETALISVWPLNGSGQFVPGLQNDRSISIGAVVVLNSGTNQASLTLLSISGAVPANAIAVTLRASVSSNTAGWSGNLTVSPDVSGFGVQTVAGSNGAANSGLFGTLADVPIVNFSQEVFYIGTISPGIPVLALNVVGYKF
jgi:hypothetical protein